MELSMAFVKKLSLGMQDFVAVSSSNNVFVVVDVDSVVDDVVDGLRPSRLRICGQKRRGATAARS